MLFAIITLRVVGRENLIPKMYKSLNMRYMIEEIEIIPPILPMKNRPCTTRPDKAVSIYGLNAVYPKRAITLSNKQEKELKL